VALPTRGLMRRYLLGDVTDQERAELEERYVHEAGVFEELIAAENELIDLHARGRLAGDERARFESHYLNTPEGRESAALGRALAEYISAIDQNFLPQQLEAKRSLTPNIFASGLIIRVAAVAAVLLVAVAAWEVIGTNRTLRRQIQELQQAQVSLSRQNQDLLQQLARANAGTGSSGASGTQQVAHPTEGGANIVQVALVADFVRGGAPQTEVAILPNTTAVNFQINLRAADYIAYDARIETPEGTNIWRKAGLHARMSSKDVKTIFLNVPATVLQKGHFILNLSGTKPDGSTQEVNSYSFHVIGK